MKRLIALLTAALLLLSIPAAIAESKYDKHVTYTGNTVHSLLAPGDDYHDALYDYIKDLFNFDFDLWYVEYGNINEKCNTWINTGSMPDGCFNRSFNYSTYLEWIDQGLIAPLPDGWETAYPNLHKMVSVSGILDYITVDGKVYTIPHAVFGNFNKAEHFTSHRSIYYRKDWLKELGMEDFGSSVTFDQLGEYIRLAKEKDLAGNGNTRGLIGSQSEIVEVFAYQTGRRYSSFERTDHGYEWGAFAPGLTDIIAILRDWYQTGLIDSDFYLTSKQDGFALFNTGLTAACYYDGSVEQIMNSWKAFEAANPGKIGKECIGATVLAGNDGIPHRPETTNYWTVTYFNPEINADVFDRILAVMDWLCDPTSGQIISRMGLENVDWKWVGENKIERLTDTNYISSYLYGMYGYCTDDVGLIRPDYDPDATAMVLANYAASEPGMIPNNFDYSFFSSESKANYSVSFSEPIVNLMVNATLDIPTEWQKFIDTNEAMWKPVVEDLNAYYNIQP